MSNLDGIKLHFLDTETTGLTRRHAIIQIAGIIEIGRNNIVEEYDMLMAPMPGDEISQRALEVNGRTEAEIATFPCARKTHTNYRRMMGKHVNPRDKADKFFMIGYNVGFDHDKMGGWFDKCDDPYLMSWFHYPVIDVAVMAGIYLMGERRRGMFKFTQEAVARHLGILEQFQAEDMDRGLHDALFDVRLSRAIFYHFYDKMMSESSRKSLLEA